MSQTQSAPGERSLSKSIFYGLLLGFAFLGSILFVKALLFVLLAAAVAAGAGRVNDGDFIIESPSRVRMILALATEAGSEIGWWNTADGGRTWKKGATLVASAERSFGLSALLRRAHPDALMLLASRHPADPHLYRQMLVVGERGPLTRPAAEAGHLGDRLERIKSLPPPNQDKAEAKRKKKAGLSDEDR